VIELSGVRASYGNVPAIDGVTINVGEGEAVGLLGANGAGKSTTLRAISGLVRLTSGSIKFLGVDLASLPPHTKEDRASSLDLVYSIFPRLAERRRQLAGTMSGGEQQMLAVGRGLMLKPRLLMLDEPSLGLAPVMCDVTFEKIAEIHKMGTAILLVEQNVSRALTLVQRAYVLESGKVILDGTSTALANNKQVQAAYLGI
jgi:branched-chain amino acid transport system ATP-binding protein